MQTQRKKPYKVLLKELVEQELKLRGLHYVIPYDTFYSKNNKTGEWTVQIIIRKEYLSQIYGKNAGLNFISSRGNNMTKKEASEQASKFMIELLIDGICKNAAIKMEIEHQYFTEI